jgi:hypothetical protein
VVGRIELEDDRVAHFGEGNIWYEREATLENHQHQAGAEQRSRQTSATATVCVIGPFEVLLAIVKVLADALVLALVLALMLTLIEVGAGVWLVTLVDPDAVVSACPYVTAAKAKHDTSEYNIPSCKE